jgi:hypothetical protein
MAGAFVAAPAASGLGKVKCKETTGLAMADPIVHHNLPLGRGHLHQFFGNNAFLSLLNPNAANHRDLVGKATNCENVADTAGYWTPALLYAATGQPVPTAAFTAYYRSWDSRSFGGGVPYPDDVRLVSSMYNWTCGQRERVEPSASIPNCGMADGRSGSRLTVHIDFPSCWDGVKPVHPATQLGDTKDNVHFAHRVDRDTCPPGFPVKTVELRMTIQYDYTGRGNDLMLASDHHAGTMDGMSMHADFWNAWVPAGFASFTRNCITPGGDRTGAECG